MFYFKGGWTEVLPKWMKCVSISFINVHHYSQKIKVYLESVKGVIFFVFYDVNDIPLHQVKNGIFESKIIVEFVEIFDVCLWI